MSQNCSSPHPQVRRSTTPNRDSTPHIQTFRCSTPYSGPCSILGTDYSRSPTRSYLSIPPVVAPNAPGSTSPVRTYRWCSPPVPARSYQRASLAREYLSSPVTYLPSEVYRVPEAARRGSLSHEPQRYTTFHLDHPHYSPTAIRRVAMVSVGPCTRRVIHTTAPVTRQVIREVPVYREVVKEVPVYIHIRSPARAAPQADQAEVRAPAAPSADRSPAKETIDSMLSKPKVKNQIHRVVVRTESTEEREYRTTNQAQSSEGQSTPTSDTAPAD